MACTTLVAQSHLEKKGDQAFDKYAFINARDYYLKVAEDTEDPSNELLEKLADSYYYTADYKNAAYWYQKRYIKESPIKAEYLYRFALSLKSAGDYNFSDKVMQEFYEAKGKDYRAKLFNQNRNYLKEIELQSGNFKIEKASFNSPLSDFAPTFYNDGILFSSNRTRPQMEKNIHAWNSQPFLDLYFVNPDSTSKKIILFSNKINTKFHESTAITTKDGNVIYFTRNNYFENTYREDVKGVNRLKLFKAVKTKDSWDIKELPFNSDEFSVAHPALSTDEKTLYFSSDMPGGYGQSDLYKVAINGNEYGIPKNLGKEVNTEGRETFPYINKSRIFFSSDGHVGLGGLDIFVSEITADGYVGSAFNVGKPINSAQDDFTFILNDDSKEGYMASNRNNKPGNDDIYKITETGTLITSCFQRMRGVVLDATSKEPLSEALVSLLNENQEVITSTYSLEDGSFDFDTQLGCTKNYAIRTQMRHYTTNEKVVATGNIPSEIVETTILLKKGDFVTGTDLGKVLDLKPIYFDFDKSNIRLDAEIELKKVIEAMQTFPDLKIDVRSHTDSRAPADYNLSLSKRRNKATIQYLIQKGNIKPARISGRGYGEEQTYNHCTDGVACTAEEHQLNRRSEFIIINK